MSGQRAGLLWRVAGHGLFSHADQAGHPVSARGQARRVAADDLFCVPGRARVLLDVSARMTGWPVYVW
jgi:hypothetical protein